MAALAANAYRESAESVPPLLDVQLRALFDDDADDAAERHAEIQASSRALVRLLGSRAREGGLGNLGFSSVGPRLASLAFAGGLELPYIFSTHHHRGARADVRAIEKAFFGIREEPHQPRAVVFTDTFTETNGVAGTMRRLAAAGARGRLSVTVAAAGSDLVEDAPGITALPTDWSMPLPAYEQIELRFPLVTDVLARLEADAPDLVHVATPGPIGITGLMAAKLLGIPVVGSYHTELGPYALQLTRDPVIAEVTGRYVDWFYRQCDLVLAPTHGVMTALAARAIGKRILVWGRGVDTADFGPVHRDEDLRSSLLDRGDTLLLSVGRVSDEKRIDVLLEAFKLLRPSAPGARLLVVGDGPARARLEEGTPEGVAFLGELRGAALARIYASADVFCFPSTTDTFGQVILEAGASGLPTLAVAAGGAGGTRRPRPDRAPRPARRPARLRSGARSPCRRPRSPAEPRRGRSRRGRPAHLGALVRRASRRLPHRRPRNAIRAPHPDRSLRSLDCAAYVRAVPSRLGSPSLDLPHGRARRLGCPRAAVVPRHARLPRGLQHLAHGRARPPQRAVHARRPLVRRCTRRPRCRAR